MNQTNKNTKKNEIINEKQSAGAGTGIPTDDIKTDETFGICKAIELAGRGKKMQRLAWQKQASHLYITIRRDETKPILTNGKHGTMYSPSIDDVMAKDWVEIL